MLDLGWNGPAKRVRQIDDSTYCKCISWRLVLRLLPHATNQSGIESSRVRASSTTDSMLKPNSTAEDESHSKRRLSETSKRQQLSASSSRRPSAGNHTFEGRSRRVSSIGVSRVNVNKSVSTVGSTVGIGGEEYELLPKPGRLEAINMIRSIDTGTDQENVIVVGRVLGKDLSVSSDIAEFQRFVGETKHPGAVIDVLSDRMNLTS